MKRLKLKMFYLLLMKKGNLAFLSEIAKTKQIFLAHLSEEANTPELALKAYEKKFKKYHIDLDKIEIRTTSQKESICGGNKNEL